MLASRKPKSPSVRARGFFMVEAIVALGIVSICAMIIGRVTDTGRGTSATNRALSRNLMYARAGLALGLTGIPISQVEVRENVAPFCSPPDDIDCPSHFRPYQQHGLSVGKPPSVVTLVKLETRSR